jgi:hypothetical protein
MRKVIGQEVVYNDKTYHILDFTPDGNYLIGNFGVCETEVSEKELVDNKFQKAYSHIILAGKKIKPPFVEGEKVKSDIAVLIHKHFN